MEGFQHFHHNNWYRRLLEIGAKLVLDPRVGLWALLAGVQVPLLPQLPGGSCIKIGLPGKLHLSKRKGLLEVLFS